MSIQVGQISGSTNKWELAQQIAGHAYTPEHILKPIFQGAINCLEERANSKIGPTMQDRVWASVSKDRLATLKETFISAFCARILGGFEDKEVKEMLDEHRETGFVSNMIYSQQLQTAYFLEKNNIIEAVVQKAYSMKLEFIEEIINAVKEEGFQVT